jgi:catechol 2,3-dioxygenase-like lactoylglutathione lyase family enzyme
MGEHRTKAMFHSTAMIRDYPAAVSRLGELFGLRVLEWSVSDDPAIGRRGGMTWIGDGSIELGDPTVEGAPPDRFVRRTGGGMHGVAVWVEDFGATVRHLEEHGVRVPVQLKGFGFSSPRDTCGLQFEWAEFTVKEDPRTGAELPPFTSTPLLDVTHHAFVGAVVDDPIAAAHRLSELLGTPVGFESPAGPPGSPQASVSLGDCTLALFPLDVEASAARWGREQDRPGVSLLGLRVDDLDAGRPVLEGAGVRILREEPGMLVLDPTTTADVQIALVDTLLPGDPRA